MANGMEMLLKAIATQLGIKPEEIKAKVEDFQKNTLGVLTNINNHLVAIEKSQAEMRQELWQMKQQLQQQSQPNQPPPLLAVQPPQNPPPEPPQSLAHQQ
jgi:cell division protein ZapA (FtsZ GTPase activity inhibitor)